MNGERREVYIARRAHQIESAVATRAYEVERAMKVREGIPLAVVLVPVPCTCEAYKVPHFHVGEDEARQRMRFRARFAPLFRFDGKVIEATGRNVAYFAGSRGEL